MLLTCSGILEKIFWFVFPWCRFPWLLNALQPEYVSNEIVKAVLRNQEFVILPRLLYFTIALKGWVC